MTFTSYKLYCRNINCDMSGILHFANMAKIQDFSWILDFKKWLDFKCSHM